MKILLYLTVGALLACSILAHAQTSTDAAPSGPPPGGGQGERLVNFLTNAEKAEMRSASKAVAASNPTLVAQLTDVIKQKKAERDAGQPLSDELKQQSTSLHEQMDAAMIKADPNVAAILAKIKAHYHGGQGGPGGGNPTPPSPDSGT
jgi:hypothetical protein